MPYVQVRVGGRTPEQKHCGAHHRNADRRRAKRENIQVTFVDLPPTNYAEAGVTLADQNRTP